MTISGHGASSLRYIEAFFSTIEDDGENAGCTAAASDGREQQAESAATRPTSFTWLLKMRPAAGGPGTFDSGR